MKILYYNDETKTWNESRFGWAIEDVAWLNSVVGWDMYRTVAA